MKKATDPMAAAAAKAEEINPVNFASPDAAAHLNAPVSALSGSLHVSAPANGQAAVAHDHWHIVPATEADWPGIWEIFHDVVRTGDTYAYYADTPYETAMDLWVRGGPQGFVVKDGEKVIGTYSLRKNHYGHGSHVANAGYMVHKDYRGQGIAKALCRHSLAEAKRQGFQTMQFNYVVSTNTTAVNLWQAMGFNIIGVAPKSYRHSQFGYVDIYIMHRFLDEVAA